MNITEKAISKMIEYYKGDPKRVHHFLKVYAFAVNIAENEGVDKKTLEIIKIASAMHDIGIKPAEIKYHSTAGKYQESEGIEPARKMLSELGADSELAERVVYLISHHHTYTNVDGIDYRILIEADFLVNAYEDNLSKQSVETAMQKIFRTKSGTEILKTLYLSE